MNRTKATLFIIFLLALFLRVTFIIFYDNGKMLKNISYADDEAGYNQIANNFLMGKGLVTDDGIYARRVPVYPFFLSLIYFLWENSFVAVRIVQAFLSALTCLLIYFATKQVFNFKISILAALISAVYYPFIIQPAYLLSELLYSFMLLAAFACFLKYQNERRIIILFIGSLLFSLAILCRDTVSYFALFIIFWLVINEWKNFAFIKPICIFIFSLFIVVGSWALRNYFIYHRFLPTTIGTGCTLYYGNNPRATGGSGGWYKNQIDAFLPEGFSGKVFTVENDAKLKKIAIYWIKDNPVRFSILCLKKFINMWRPYYADARGINKVIMVFSYIPILALGIIGVMKSFYQYWRKLLIIYLFIFYYIVIHLVTLGEIRYRYPIMPFLIIFCAFALYGLREQWILRKKS